MLCVVFISFNVHIFYISFHFDGGLVVSGDTQLVLIGSGAVQPDVVQHFWMRCV